MYYVLCIPFLIRLVSRLLYHDVARACGPMYFFVCRHLGGLGGPRIYMSIHVYGDPNVFYMCFLVDVYDGIYSICYDRMYDVFMCV